MDDFKHHARHTILARPEYNCVLDEFRRGDDQSLVIHAWVDRKKFTRQLMQQFVNEWRLFRSVVSAPIFAIEEAPNDKHWRAFVSHFGFRFLTLRPDPRDGIDRAVFVSFKDNNNNAARTED